MEIGSKIHDKLITDFAALKFSDNTTLLFNNVKKFYRARSMEARDCLIIPEATPENVEGGGAGNTQTTRIYTFRAIVFEEIEATDNDTNGSIKYSRLLNIQDSLLDYLQKEPSNLNSWGNSNNIFIYKIRVNNVSFDTQQSEGGYAAILDISFAIYLNVIPQNL